MYISNDKSGGFTAMDLQTYQEVMLSILRPKAYMPMSRTAFDALEPTKVYISLCVAVSHYHDDLVVGRALRRSLAAPGPRGVAIMKMLTNAHKAQGSVLHGNWHTCPVWRFGGLALWIDHVVSARLKEIAPHLLSGSEDLVSRLSSTKLCASSRFARIDLEEFFMSGEAAELTSDLHLLWPDNPRLADLVPYVSRWLLSIQRSPYQRSLSRFGLCEARKRNGRCPQRRDLRRRSVRSG